MNLDKVIQIKCEAKSYYQLDDLNHFQGKLKSIDKDRFDKLKKSLIRDGLPIGFHVWIDKKNKVWTIDGHHRVLALKALRDDGYDIPSLPCVIVQANNKKEAAKAVLINNSKYAKINQESLSDFMIDFELNIDDLNFLDLPDLNMDDFGLDEKTKEGLTDDDSVPEVEQNIHGVTLGDIYQLGNHRLMCGDSTSIDAVEKLMDGQKADITFTSPPYNVGKTPNGNDQKYLNDSDNKSNDEFKNLLNLFTKNCLNYSDYVFSNIQSLSGNKIALIEHLYDLKDKFADTIIWDKKTAEPAMARRVLNSRFEYIHIFSNEAKRTIGKRDFRGTIANIFELNSRQGKEYANIHKATFPVQLPIYFIENFTESSCIDPFGGTGTTLIACEKTNRKCFMMELDPHYCSVIIERWQNFTGLKAKLITK